MARMSLGERLRNLFHLSKRTDEEFFENLTDILIEGDITANLAFEISENLESVCKKTRSESHDEIMMELKKILLGFIKTVNFEPDYARNNIFLVLGVNGVGKTTSIAKLAALYSETAGAGRVIMAAADTFRAAAIEQLQIHGQRLGVRVVAHQNGSDPASVVFDAASAMAANGGGLVLADTAGRLHNKENLVNELKKIDRIARSKAGEGCYKKILVLDSTTGQNALRQAEVFHKAVGVDAVVLTKCDSTAKGGAAFTVGRELGIPLSHICFGESYADISAVDAEAYTERFLGMR